MPEKDPHRHWTLDSRSQALPTGEGARPDPTDISLFYKVNSDMAQGGTNTVMKLNRELGQDPSYV